MSQPLPDDDTAGSDERPCRPVSVLAEWQARANELERLAASRGAARLRVFGPPSRGEGTADGDIDLPRGHDVFARRPASSDALERPDARLIRRFHRLSPPPVTLLAERCSACRP